MDQNTLEKLIDQQESSTLEFKQELHRIFDEDDVIKRRHRHELIRDILSLANGNTITAGENAYLIYGVDDKFDIDGRRRIHGIKGKTPSTKELLAIVKPVSDPPLENVLCETFFVNNKAVFVVTIFSSPYIHETNRKLETPRREYSEHVVFIRRGDEIAIASAKERSAIQDLKAFRYNETNKIDPVLFGLLNGSIISGVMTSALSEMFNKPKEQRYAITIAGSLVGGIVGVLIGFSCKSIIRFRQDLQTIPAKWRPITVIITICTSIASVPVIRKILQLIGRRVTLQ